MVSFGKKDVPCSWKLLCLALFSIALIGSITIAYEWRLAVWIFFAIGGAVAAIALPLTKIVGLIFVLLPFQLFLPLIDAPTISLAEALVVIAFCKFLIQLLLDQRRLVPTSLDKLILIIIMTVILSFFFSPSFNSSLKGTILLAIFFMIYYLVTNTATTKVRVYTLINYLLAGGIAQSAIGLLQFLGGEKAAWGFLLSPLAPWLYHPDRLAQKVWAEDTNFLMFGRYFPFGTFVNSIDYAVYLAMISGLSISLTLCLPPSRSRKIKGLTSIILVGMTALTLKGTGWVALIAGLIFIALLRLANVTSIIVIGGIILAMGMVTGLYEISQQRVGFFLSPEGSLIRRLPIWKHYLQVFAERPIIGHGFYTSLLFAPLHSTYQRGVRVTVSCPTENFYVALLVEVGLIGLITFVCVFIQVVKTALQSYRRSRVPELRGVALGIGAASVALAAGNFTANIQMGEQISLLFWSIAGLAVALSRLEGKHVDSRSGVIK